MRVFGPSSLLDGRAQQRTLARAGGFRCMRGKHRKKRRRTEDHSRFEFGASFSPIQEYGPNETMLVADKTARERDKKDQNHVPTAKANGGRAQ